MAGVAIVACSPRPAPTASSAATPFGSPIAIDPAAGWQLADLRGVPATILSDVIAVPDGFLAAGAAGQALEMPLVLHSTDGQAWTAETIDSRVGSPNRLAAWDGQIVAVGAGVSDRCAHPGELDAWARAADTAWEKAPFEPQFCLGGGNRTLLVHDDHPLLVGASTGDVPYVMSSDDGLHWIDHQRPFGEVYPRASGTDDEGLWVFGSGPDGRPVVVHSIDGQSFDAPAVIPGLGPDAGFLDAVSPGGRLAVVVTSGLAAGILRRDDGGGWLVEFGERPARRPGRADRRGRRPARRPGRRRERHAAGMDVGRWQRLVPGDAAGRG